MFRVGLEHLKPCCAFLKRYGHLPEVPHGNLGRLDARSRVLADGIRSYQEVEIQTGAIDDVLGPKTLAAMLRPRCQVPDRFDDPEVAGEFLQGTGTGSWDAGCLPEFAGIHAIVVNLITRGMQSTWKDNLDTILANITKAEHEVGLHPVFKLDHAGHSHMTITWRPIIGGTIGYNTVPRDPSCSTKITGSIDSTYNATIQLLTILALHEWFLHGVGLGHTRGGIGNPIILNVPPTWEGDPSYNNMIRFFGGPINLDPKPGPGPTPTPGPQPKPTPQPSPCGELIQAIFKGCN